MKLVPTTEAWLQLACADLPTLLVDHAHCEKKAAHTAVRFLFKYPEWPELVTAMSRLAREELVHFDQVLREMKTRNIVLKKLTSANYAAELFAAAKKFGDLGELVACALIEARSHERFVKLAERVSDQSLADFYRDLAIAEERHGDIYLDLARQVSDGQVGRSLEAIIDEMIVREGEIISRSGQPLRMHAG